MSYRNFFFAWALLPLAAWAQQPPAHDGHAPAERPAEAAPPNATTLAVLRANCPKDMAEADWLKLMEQHANRALYPLRVSPAMLDTLDGMEMDLRYQYLLVPNEP